MLKVFILLGLACTSNAAFNRVNEEEGKPLVRRQPKRAKVALELSGSDAEDFKPVDQMMRREERTSILHANGVVTPSSVDLGAAASSSIDTSGNATKDAVDHRTLLSETE